MPARSPLLGRFVENERVLNQVHDQLLARGDRRAIRSIDAEWLVDNFHIIDDSLREVRRDLPPGYDEQLPKLAVAPAVRLSPRLCAGPGPRRPHRQRAGRDADRAVRPGVPGGCSLDDRRALGLAHHASPGPPRKPPPPGREMIWGWDEQQRAERWARRGRAGKDGPAAIALKTPPRFGELSDPFVVRLMQLLATKGRRIAPRASRGRAGRQARPERGPPPRASPRGANQVTVGNCVLSLRLLSAIDWNSFFEQSSRVEAILREDPSGIYRQQDFATSDRYRRMVETIARGSHADEIDVARCAIELARPRSRRRATPPRDHVGYLPD